MNFRFFIALILGLTLSFPALANERIIEAALTHARTQSQGLPGTVTILAGSLDPSTRLPACDALQAYTPPGSRPWGKTHVGVRCLAPHTWNILVPVQISVQSSYLVTARPLAAGMILQASDVNVVQGDLATLPNGVLTESERVVGKTLKNSLAAGQPLRGDQLLAPILVRQGQTVKLISRGNGFVATSEGKALNNAVEGQVVQIKASSGQTLSGIVQRDGSVEMGK